MDFLTLEIQFNKNQVKQAMCCLNKAGLRSFQPDFIRLFFAAKLLPGHDWYIANFQALRRRYY